MPVGMQLPDAFRNSYINFKTYPKNLVYQTSYPATLVGYHTRLENVSQRLLVGQDIEQNVVFRDFTGQAFERQNVCGDALLKKWIGDISIAKVTTPNVAGSLATKKDPKCRFM